MDSLGPNLGRGKGQGVWECGKGGRVRGGHRHTAASQKQNERSSLQTDDLAQTREDKRGFGAFCLWRFLEKPPGVSSGQRRDPPLKHPAGRPQSFLQQGCLFAGAWQLPGTPPSPCPLPWLRACGWLPRGHDEGNPSRHYGGKAQVAPMSAAGNLTLGLATV